MAATQRQSPWHLQDFIVPGKKDVPMRHLNLKESSPPPPRLTPKGVDCSFLFLSYLETAAVVFSL